MQILKKFFSPSVWAKIQRTAPPPIGGRPRPPAPAPIGGNISGEKAQAVFTPRTPDTFSSRN